MYGNINYVILRQTCQTRKREKEGEKRRLSERERRRRRRRIFFLVGILTHRDGTELISLTELYTYIVHRKTFSCCRLFIVLHAIEQNGDTSLSIVDEKETQPNQQKRKTKKEKKKNENDGEETCYRELNNGTDETN